MNVSCNFAGIVEQFKSVENVMAFNEAVTSELTTATEERVKALGAKMPKKNVSEKELLEQVFSGVDTEEKLKHVLALVKDMAQNKKSEFTTEVKVEIKAEKKPDKKTREIKTETKVSKESREKSKSNKSEVEMLMSIDAKVRKELALTLTQYVKKDGEVSKIYIFKAGSDEGTKSLQKLMESDAYKELAHWKRWAMGYVVNEKDIKEFSKLTGVKAVKAKKVA